MIKANNFFTALLAVFFMLTVIGCNVNSDDEPTEKSSIAEGASGKRTITDMAGRMVDVPEEIHSVLGLTSTNRFFVYLNSADKMAAVREAETGPVHTRPWEIAISSKIEEMPAFDESDLEKIVKLDPDVILRCHSVATNDYQNEERLQLRTNIPVVIGKPYVSLSKNTEEFYETVELVGDLLGKKWRAEELVSGVKEIIDDLNERTRDIAEEDKPAVYVGGKSWAGSHSITSTSSFYSAFDLINAKNVAAEVGEENAFIDAEALIAWDPDMIFIEKSSGYELCLEDLNKPEFQSLSAVENDEVYRIFLKINNNTNFENVLVNAYYIGSVIYPERFSDVNFKEKADEIYELFLGRPIYEEAEAAGIEGGHEKLERAYREKY